MFILIFFSFEIPKCFKYENASSFLARDELDSNNTFQMFICLIDTLIKMLFLFLLFQMFYRMKLICDVIPFFSH